MSALFSTAMHRAPAILFGVALLLVVAGCWPVLVAAQSMAHTLQGAPEGYGSMLFAQSISGGISSAVWPFFGAALLWRLDRWGKISMGAAE